jgi:hypothetical protein
MDNLGEMGAGEDLACSSCRRRRTGVGVGNIAVPGGLRTINRYLCGSTQRELPEGQVGPSTRARRCGIEYKHVSSLPDHLVVA